MVIQAFCNECKGEPCCNRTLELHSIQDEYSHLTNILVRINCELFIHKAYFNTAYGGTLNHDIRFEKDKFTQCDCCLYKSVCKYDPEVVTKGANEVLDRLKEKLDVKVACVNFHPDQQQTEETEAYSIEDTIDTFCELLNLKKINLSTFTGKEISVFVSEDIPVDIVKTNDKHNKSKDLIVMGLDKNNKEKKGFFKGRKR